MIETPYQPFAEHPLDVLRFLKAQLANHRPCALAILTDTTGGAVRAPGAVMAICETGQSCGYLSGGCIDADVKLHARTALRHKAPSVLRYGKGSPFLDITLPCGGAIEVTVLPTPDEAEITKIITTLEARKSAVFSTSGFQTIYHPKLRLRIAGRGADPLALARASLSAGIETEFWTADTVCLEIARSLSNLSITPLQSPLHLPICQDDQNTAFVLMMHDEDWEAPLLKQALTGSAFYIGAVGSPNTHNKRCQSLIKAGIDTAEIDRIHGPVGLVPSLRDASMLAISTLAQIISLFRSTKTDIPSNSRVLLDA